MSLFVTSQLAAFAFAAGTQAVLFLIYLVAYLCIITYAPANSIDADILLSNWIVSLFSPSSSLLRGLLLSLNEFSVTCDGFAFASHPGNIKVYGEMFTSCQVYSSWLTRSSRWTNTVPNRPVHRTDDLLDMVGCWRAAFPRFPAPLKQTAPGPRRHSIRPRPRGHTRVPKRREVPRLGPSRSSSDQVLRVQYRCGQRQFRNPTFVMLRPPGSQWVSNISWRTLHGIPLITYAGQESLPPSVLFVATCALRRISRILSGSTASLLPIIAPPPAITWAYAHR